MDSMSHKLKQLHISCQISCYSCYHTYKEWFFHILQQTAAYSTDARNSLTITIAIIDRDLMWCGWFLCITCKIILKYNGSEIEVTIISILEERALVKFCLLSESDFQFMWVKVFEKLQSFILVSLPKDKLT